MFDPGATYVSDFEACGPARARCGVGGARRGARRGRARRGPVVFVTGEPGIGKTSLVDRFVRDLDATARVLVGTCDDLVDPAAARPVPRPRRQRLRAARGRARAGAAPHDIQDLLIAELERAPRPDGARARGRALGRRRDARLDHACSAGGSARCRRCSCSRSAPARRRPATRCTPRSARSGPTRSVLRRAGAAVGRARSPSLAGDDGDGVYAATGGNPFYVTELLASRAAAELPPSVANAVLGRASRLDEAVAAAGGAGVGRPEPRRHVAARRRDARLGRRRPRSRSAGSCSRSTRTYVRFRHELARNAIRSSVPSAARRRLHAEILEALLAADADPADIVHHAEAAGAEDVVAELRARRRAARGRAGVEPRGVLPLPPRRRLRRPAAAGRAGRRARGAGGRGLRGRPARGRVRRRSSARSRSTASSATRPRSAAARASCRASTGTPATATRARRTALEAIAILEPLGESVELARAYSGAVAARDAGGGHRAGARVGRAGARARDAARRREHARARARQHRQRAAAAGPRRDAAPLLEAHAVADAAGDRARGDARARQPRLRADVLGAARAGAALRAAGRSRTPSEHEVHTLALLRRDRWSPGCGCAPASGTRPSAIAHARDRAGHHGRRSCSRRRCWPSSRSAAATPTPRERLADLAAQADRAGELQRIAPALELAAEWALTTGAPMPTERFEQRSPRAAAARRAWPAGARPRRRVGGGRRARRRARPAAAPARTRPCCGATGAAAADAFGEVGWSYDRALMLSLLDDEEALAEAIEIARGLGAEPLTRRVAGAHARARAARPARAARGDARQSRPA